MIFTDAEAAPVSACRRSSQTHLRLANDFLPLIWESPESQALRGLVLGIRPPPTTPFAHRKSRPVARAAAALCMNDEIIRRFTMMRVHPGDVVNLIQRSNSIERRLGGVC